jgi:RNA polymerase sigma-70 factor (ECF subfamily)
MTVDQVSVEAMIALARQETSGLGPLLERYRGFLLTEGQRQIGTKLSARVGAEDVVQETFLKAVQRFHQFAGTTEPEFSAWLRTIYANELRDLLRKHGLAEGRDAALERTLCGGDEESASLIWNEPAASQSTPSQRLIKAEKALRLAELLQTLPKPQRDAVRLRHLDGWPLDKIAAELGRSVAATAGLIKRGLKALRAAMSQDSWMSAK